MTESNDISAAQIDELLRFLPLLDKPGHDFIQKWHGGGSQFPYPVYEPVVEHFIAAAGQTHWLDFGYQPQQAGEMLYDDSVLSAADLPTIKTMLTFVVRGERFGDGHWGSLLQNGRIVALLKRLETIRTE